MLFFFSYILQDFINVMTYDFASERQTSTGHNAPLYHAPDATGYSRTATAQFAIQRWLDGGADRRKLVFGIPLYGYAYILSDPTDTEVGSLVNMATSANISGSYGNVSNITTK